MTAFASIMVVLVVALMIIDTTMVSFHHGSGPVLPRVAYPIAMSGALRGDAVSIAVRRDGRIYLGSDELMASDLPARLRPEFGRGAEQKVYIRADARAKYRDMKSVLDSIRAVGVEKIGFLVEQKRSVV